MSCQKGLDELSLFSFFLYSHIYFLSFFYLISFASFLFPHSALIPCRDIVDSIAIRYGLNGPGIENRWERAFPARPDRPRHPPKLLRNLCRRGRVVMLASHPHLASPLRMGWSCTSGSPLCLRRHFVGSLSHLLLYLTPYPSNGNTIEPSVLLCYLFICTHFYSREQL
jgi:hypothetical protein